jgi:SAM-dependent methyltransferase
VFPFTHPARLQAVARLFGLDPAPASGCRVLELGCGDGANALAIAQTLPDAYVVGLDIAAAAIERGEALRRAAGLDNIELRVADLLDLERAEDLGPVDYIVAHGVYSWIPPATRAALLDCCRRCLAPHGIALVSYNAYPGSYLRDVTRDILTFHLRGVTGSGDRVFRARELMQAIAAVDTPTPYYARVLREHFQRRLGVSAAMRFHDDLDPVSTPFYFHEFIEQAAAHGLQFLSEADLGDSQMGDLSASVRALIASQPDDVILREQYLDFFRGRMFRRTLLVGAAAPVRRPIEDVHIEGMALSSPAGRDAGRFATPGGDSSHPSDPLVVAAMDELCDCWPASLAFGELAERARRRASAGPLSPQRIEQLRGAMLEGYLGRVVLLNGCALPVSSRPGEHPRASPLARAQCVAGRPMLSTLVPGNQLVEEEFARRLLPLLDGTRDRGALASELDVAPESLDGALARLAKLGFLCAIS